MMAAAAIILMLFDKLNKNTVEILQVYQHYIESNIMTITRVYLKQEYCKTTTVCNNL